MTESGFDPGLQDPARSGVFFVTSEDLPLLAAAAHDAGLLPRQIARVLGLNLKLLGNLRFKLRKLRPNGGQRREAIERLRIDAQRGFKSGARPIHFA